MENYLRNEKVDLLLKNGNIINVFDGSIYKGDVAIVKDIIIGVGEACEYIGQREIDCSELYISPAFIESHVHIESSKVIPEVFSKILLSKGVTTCIADPHEIANVLGETGLEFMIENSKNSDIDIYFMLPSCVPAVPTEDNGAILRAENLEKFKKYDAVLGLGEVMDVQAVINSNKDMKAKLEAFKDYAIDGHCPDISIKDLNKYILSGVKTDHECTKPEEALEKIKRGMYVMLREGSAAKNLEQLLPAVKDGNFHRFLFCTDDKDINDLVDEGSVDYNVRLSIKLGLDPVKAIIIASYNAANCYSISNKGAIAPGYMADLLIFDSLEDININKIIRKGKEIEDNRTIEGESFASSEMNIKSSMNIDKVEEDLFKIEVKGEKINTIKVLEKSIVTEKVLREVSSKGKYIEDLKEENLYKIGVLERHKGTGKKALGFIEGLDIGNCTIAQTIAHDSHNIIVVGKSDKDMAMAVNRLIDIKGGIVLVSNGEVIEELSLPIAGLMTYEDPSCLISKINNMNNYINKDSGKNSDVFLTLGFMALSVIPELKITTRGLYDFGKGCFIDVFRS
ncbi:adenine deaminase [Clostridium sp. DL1XJH146]